MPESVTNMLCNYSLKASAEQLNNLNVDDNGVTPIDKFSDITAYINLEHHHTWIFPVYILDSRLQDKNIPGLPK